MDGRSYIFDESGRMLTGWFDEDGRPLDEDENPLEAVSYTHLEKTPEARAEKEPEVKGKAEKTPEARVEKEPEVKGKAESCLLYTST